MSVSAGTSCDKLLQRPPAMPENTMKVCPGHIPLHDTCLCGHDTCSAPIPSFGGAEMTNLVTHHVEECHQVRGHPRKLTQAPIVIPTLIPTWYGSCNLPLIVLEAFKDILCDSREARTRRWPWRPMVRSLDSFFLRSQIYLCVYRAY